MQAILLWSELTFFYDIPNVVRDPSALACLGKTKREACRGMTSPSAVPNEVRRDAVPNEVKDASLTLGKTKEVTQFERLTSFSLRI